MGIVWTARFSLSSKQRENEENSGSMWSVVGLNSGEADVSTIVNHLL